jgi:hypothetical protein
MGSTQKESLNKKHSVSKKVSKKTLSNKTQESQKPTKRKRKRKRRLKMRSELCRKTENIQYKTINLPWTNKKIKMLTFRKLNLRKVDVNATNSGKFGEIENL